MKVFLETNVLYAPAATRGQCAYDLPILGTAVSAGAEVFVTGDKELQDFGRIGHVEILSPMQFRARLRTRKQRGASRGATRRSYRAYGRNE